MEKTRQCILCGKTFAREPERYYCSQNCKNMMEHILVQDGKKNPMPNPGSAGLLADIRNADKSGLSYGRYIPCKHQRLEKHS